MPEAVRHIPLVAPENVHPMHRGAQTLTRDRTPIALNLLERDTKTKVGLKNRSLNASVNDALSRDMPGW